MATICLRWMADPCMAPVHRIQVPKCGVSGVCILHPKTVIYARAGDPAGTDPVAPWGGLLGKWVHVGGSMKSILRTECPNYTLKVN